MPYIFMSYIFYVIENLVTILVPSDCVSAAQFRQNIILVCKVELIEKQEDLKLFIIYCIESTQSVSF